MKLTLPRCGLPLQHSNTHDFYYDMQFFIRNRKQRCTSGETDVGKLEQVLATWLLQACDVIARLDNKDMGTLYIYTTQFYGIINDTKSGRPNSAVDELAYRQLSDEDCHQFLYEQLSLEGSGRWFVDGRVPPCLQQVRDDCRRMSSKRAYDKAYRIFKQQYLQVQHQRLLKRNFFTAANRNYQLVRGVQYFYFAALDVGAPAFHPHPHPAVPTFLRAPTLIRFISAVPFVSATGWRMILDAFVRRLDGLFEKMPPLPVALTVYRGTRTARVRSRKTYTSCTLQPNIAKDFAKGPEATVHVLRIPTGSRVLPLMPLTRYAAECEVLLHPDTKYTSVS